MAFVSAGFNRSCNAKTLRAIQNMLRICFCKITFRETEIMDGIQQVGFANAVVSADANNTLLKRKRQPADNF